MSSSLENQFLLRLVPLATLGVAMAMFMMADAFGPVRYHSADLVIRSAASITPVFVASWLGLSQRGRAFIGGKVPAQRL